jgi:hypothetical protein
MCIKVVFKEIVLFYAIFSNKKSLSVSIETRLFNLLFLLIMPMNVNILL